MVFDNENNTLYFMPPEGVNPSEENIRVKTQAYGFSSENGDRITLENIDFSPILLDSKTVKIVRLVTAIYCIQVILKDR